ncbi:hypothetical protein DH2020_002294 [Rehmannia glutinosa]|uniref:F-box domain-containing protein n=1 Tax=Rehmannia glutinosa TaxID=99300 RepID=A0ABR0XT97_REHGL
MDHQKAESGVNFLECLETDMSVYIMSFLDDPADLVRASAVSRFWRHFVITNGLAKQLCLKTFPQLSNIVDIVNASNGATNSMEVETEKTLGREILERDHKVYASLHQALTKSKVSPKDCIGNAVSATSTDRFPDESVVNTLNPRDRFIRRASYWSSKGQSNPAVPETLIYKLRAGIWVITEIDVQPFEAFFPAGKPIYSAKAVRFRLGHPRPLSEIGDELRRLPLHEPADDMFQWTYTSPEFPMTQENRLQPFKLPEPVLCIDGYLQIELLGRVQRQEMDGLFYIWLCVLCSSSGAVPFSAFDMEVLEPCGNKKFVLKHYPENLNAVLEKTPDDDDPHLRQPEEEMLWDRLGLLEDLLRGIRQGPNNAVFQDEDDED